MSFWYDARNCGAELSIRWQTCAMSGKKLKVWLKGVREAAGKLRKFWILWMKYAALAEHVELVRNCYAVLQEM